MNDWALAFKSLLFHRQVNLAVVLGVAAATAVLTGALIVGDSMRGSLRDLTLDRLGKIDLLVTSEGFFREALAEEIINTPAFQAEFDLATPAIFFPNGTAGAPQNGRTVSVGEVNVLGVRPKFWELGGHPTDHKSLASDEALINQVLADDLGISETSVRDGTARLTVGIPKQRLLPADSSLGAKDDLVERIVDLKVVDVVPATGLGRFDLHTSQIPPRNVYLNIEAVQGALVDLLKYKTSSRQANIILIAGQSLRRPPSASAVDDLRNSLQPTLADLGVRIKRVTQRFEDETVFDYYSVSSERLVIPAQGAASIRAAFPEAVELFTYLATDISKITPSDSGEAVSGIPFSMVTSVDSADAFRLQSTSGEDVRWPESDEIILNQWAAEDLQIGVGEKVRLTYFEPETTHGDEVSRTTEMTVAGIARLARPSEPFEVNRRGEVRAAVFEEKPTLANDPDLTPEVPGLTDAESIERWILPFATPVRPEGQDDDYWNYYRTTPKAFVSLEQGRQLWSSRFGDTTSFRISAESSDQQQIEREILAQFRADGHLLSMQVVPIKANALSASSGSTPFDVLFLGLSMFVIAAALILVSLLFRLGLQQRSDELGTLLTVGFRQKRVAKVWLIEMSGVCLGGAILGVVLGLGYAALMILGLNSPDWWLGAISAPFLNLHLNWWTLMLGLFCGVLICVGTIYGSIRAARKKSVRSLLSGQIESMGKPRRGFSPKLTWVTWACLIAAVVLAMLAAFSLTGESQAGAFMTSGFLVLVSLLLVVWRKLVAMGLAPKHDTMTVGRLAWSNAGRNPLRSTLTIGLVAVASFLILAISAFQLAPTEQGTAGFDWVAKTSQPVLVDLNSAEGQARTLVGTDNRLAANSVVLSFRYKAGEDASCNNPYQSSQPQVLGVTRQTLEHFQDPASPSFEFTMTPTENWELLFQPPDDNGAIPVIIDKNTAWYSLKVYVPGSTFTVAYDSGQVVTFRLVGLLSNSVLQGNLLISEENFTKEFPTLSGYQFFLIRASQDDVKVLAESLSDQGFDARSAPALLKQYLDVQNTYLSTFQSLGALGLLLGTFGLAAVQLRSVVERRRELGLMRAVGFSRSRLATTVLLENGWLLLVGMGTGIAAALVTTMPHYFFGDVSVPWRELLKMFAVIVVVGLLTSWLASRSIFKAPLIESLRGA